MNSLSSAPPEAAKPCPPISPKLTLAGLMNDAREASSAAEFAAKYPNYYLVRMGLVGGEILTPKRRIGSITSEFRLPVRGSVHSPSSDESSGDAFEIPICSVGQQGVVIGRSPHAYLQLRDVSVSGRHAEITVRNPSRVMIRDLTSKNGTRLNHKLIPCHQSIAVECGDLISFGRLSLQFYRPESLFRLLKLLTR